jgi:hypothetical protein
MSERKDPDRPDRSEGHPRSSSGRGGFTSRRIGAIAVAVVVVGLLWWALGGGQPGQEHTLGEPAGVGTTAAPEADTAIDPAADPDDPQAAIGADPHSEPTSPAAAEQADIDPPPANDGDAAPEVN